MREPLKSNLFQIKDEFGGGFTSYEEIEALLKLLVAKGFFERRLEKNGEYSYKQKEGIDEEELRKFLSKEDTTQK